MKDSFLDWVESHRKLVIFIIIVFSIFCVMLGIRTYNLSRKGTLEQVSSIETDSFEDIETTELVTEPKPSYESSLNNRIDETSKKQDDENKPEEETLLDIKPNIDVSCSIWKHVNVPDRNPDGSSYKKYLSRVNLASFDTWWGTSLDINDTKSTTIYHVGSIKETDEAKNDELKSVGWVMDNLASFNKSDAIRFTNLYTIGSLSDNHVAVLCSYTWHSVFGLENTMVLFEDISGTLNPNDFVEGATFSATVFVHNVKIERVNGQNVLCVQYNVFK